MSMVLATEDIAARQQDTLLMVVLCHTDFLGLTGL